MVFPGRQLNIKLLDRCNAACSFCGYNRDRLSLRIAGGYKPYQLDADDLIHRFPALRAKGIGILHLTGGEPTMHPDFARLVQAAKSGGFKVRTGTNGSLLDEKTAWMLRDCGVDHLWYSLDTFPFEDHLRHRGFSRFRERMEWGLECLRRYKVNFFAQTVLSRVLPWRNGLPDITGHMDYYRREYGFRRFVFSYPMHQAGKSEHLAREGGDAVNFSGEELHAMLLHLLELKSTPSGRGIVNPRVSLRVQLRELEGRRMDLECRAGRDIFFLGGDGRTLRPCYHLADEIVDSLDGKPLLSDGRFRSCTACKDQCFRDPSLLYEAARDPARFSGEMLKNPETAMDLARDAWDLIRTRGYTHV